jgi:2-hydroxy-6-oxonona-2,4-dienedioate hydrolase
VEEVKENKVMLNDLEIRYLKSEKRNSSKKKNILFIHGLGSSSDRWLDIPDALSRYFHPIVAVDLIGFGGSDKPVTVDYTIEYFSKFIGDFIDCKQIWRNDDDTDDDSCKTIIVGHSLGGYIAAKVAIESQDLIEKLVLIDSSGMLKEPTPLLEQYLNAALNPSYENVKNVLSRCLEIQRYSILRSLTTLLKELTWQGRNMHLNQLSKIVQKSILNHQNYKGLRIYRL